MGKKINCSDGYELKHGAFPPKEFLLKSIIIKSGDFVNKIPQAAHTMTMKKKQFLKNAAAGTVIGLVNGFFGSGGGIIAVSLMTNMGIDQKKAHASSILIILPLSVMSGVIYYLNGHVDLSNGAWMLLVGGAAGGFLGAVLLKKLSGRWVEIIFCLLIIASGVRMVL